MRECVDAVAAGGAPPGRYQLLAAINAVHTQARSARETDWGQVVALYDRLVVLDPSPIVHLNRAIALAEQYDAARGLPMALGREAAGAVVRDPPWRFRAGELVFGSCASGFGALGDLVLLDVEQTARVPEGATPEQAACIPVAIGTAWVALAELAVGRGHTVLVVGAGGGVGEHAVQLAHHLGARVIGVAGAGKAELVASAGAEHIPSGPGWNEAVAALAPRASTP
ncbi:hypothetical protein MHL29_10810 [Arsenicicoccus bolidensis]|uniref:Enoyl reductase (ER) domain-containing protein n=1 Tax=Arsenicicoccus bolidensis TaxID=229480 RepID=A0ABS9Q3C3_9MICO|nr:hypothetical protein [Arsenicicoccus bolidensis]